MRSIFIAMLMTAGIAMLGSSPGLAAPAYGIAIGNAASFGVVTEQAGWGYWRHRHPTMGTIITAAGGAAQPGRGQLPGQSDARPIPHQPRGTPAMRESAAIKLARASDKFQARAARMT